VTDISFSIERFYSRKLLLSQYPSHDLQMIKIQTCSKNFRRKL